MRHIAPVDHLSDRELLDATERAATDECQLTAELLALLGEVDARRLYLGQSCASLFTYCTQVLHFSEHAAYHRIEAARSARQWPVILDMVAEGALTLTTVTLLRPHLTRQNHAALLDAARHKSKREVEHLIVASCAEARRGYDRAQAGAAATAPGAAHVRSSAASLSFAARVAPARSRDTGATFAGTISPQGHAQRRDAREAVPRSGSDPSHDPERRPCGRHRSSIDAAGWRVGADQGREDRALGTGIAIEPALIVTESRIGPPHSGIDPSHRVGTRRGTLRVRRRARPVHGNWLPRIPSPRSVR